MNCVDESRNFFVKERGISGRITRRRGERRGDNDQKERQGKAGGWGREKSGSEAGGSGRGGSGEPEREESASWRMPTF
jgi:hypothetical protein